MSVSQDSELSSTPLPVPSFFRQAEQSFSLKKRRLPHHHHSSSSSSSTSPPTLSRSLPPRPPCKGVPPVSRVFPQRPPSWSQPRPRPVSQSLSPPQQLPRSLYNPSTPQSYFQQCFTCLGLLGRGSFGEVYKVRSHQDGQLYAVKRSVQRFRGDSDRRRCLREPRNHERLPPHPNVLGFRAAWEEAGRLYIQTELCRASLLEHCEAQPRPPGEALVWAYLSDLLCALGHLHSQGFVHMDVKPANIFLSPSGRCKLGDFGLLLELKGEGGKEGQRRVEGSERGEAQEGDPRYMAPELLTGHYSQAADVFSLGLSILELACSLELPHGGEDWQQLRKGYLPPEFTAALSSELQAVLRRMLEPDPSLRATVPELLSLPALRRVRWRRYLALALAETLFSLTSLCQSVFSVLWGALASLPLPLSLPRLRTTPPHTPPAAARRSPRDGSPHLSEPETGSLGDEIFSLPTIDPDYSPTLALSHSISGRVALAGTSTPRPLSPHPDRRTHSVARSSPDVSRVSEEPLPSPALTADPVPASDPIPRSAFEPRNLLSLFEEISLEQN